MANAKSHKLDTPETHILVADDKQPRDAEYTTTYDDGTTSKTIHKLYWHVHKDKDGKETGEVRSMPIEDWTGAAPTEPDEPPPLPYPGAIVHVVIDTINRHVAAIVTATPYQDHYDVDVAAFDNEKTRLEWYKKFPNDEARARIPSWHWPGTFFANWITPHEIPESEQSPFEQGALAGDVPPAAG